jgi:hypothetical protein
VVSTNFIIGVIFNNGTVDAERYTNDMHFFATLAPAEQIFDYFMEMGVIPHTTKESIQALCGVFEECNGDDKIISKILLFTRSPDLISQGFYFVGKTEKCYVCQQST